jgi:hypothetical protein
MDSEFAAPELLTRLAAQALEQAADPHSHAAASRTLETIYLDFGHQGMYFTFMMWVDLSLNAMRAELLEDGTRRLRSRSFIETCVSFAEWVNPPAAWAGQLVLARADWDHARCAELYESVRCCGSEEYANNCVLALVEFTVVAATLGEEASRYDAP